LREEIFFNASCETGSSTHGGVLAVLAVLFGRGNIFLRGEAWGKGRILAGGILAKRGKTAHKELAQRGFGGFGSSFWRGGKYFAE
jgi:hypothetical protein